MDWLEAAFLDLPAASDSGANRCRAAEMIAQKPNW